MVVSRVPCRPDRSRRPSEPTRREKQSGKTLYPLRPPRPRRAGDRCLAGAIAGVAPRTIITLDPRHGTTCHNAHRTIGRLVLRAFERLNQPAPEVFLLERRVRIAPGGTSIRFSSAAPGDPELLRFDANTPLRPGRGTAWDFLLDDARRQPSQFDATFLASMLAVPATHRDVYLLPAAALTTDPNPIDRCTP